MKRLFVVRHGESEANVELRVHDTVPNRYIPLTENGKKHAKDAANKIFKEISPINSHDSTIIFCSDYKRAKDTALFIHKRISNSKIIENVLLAEQCYGIATGHPSTEQYCFDKPDQEKLLFSVGKMYMKLPQGESKADVALRAEIFLQRMLLYKKTNNIITVSHMGFCSMLHDQIIGSYSDCYDWKNGEIRLYGMDYKNEWLKFKKVI